MWHCAVVCLLLVALVWLFTFGVVRRSETAHNATSEVSLVRRAEGNGTEAKGGFGRAKVKQHVPKFMLELYEKSKTVGPHQVNRFTMPEIVRSVVPSHSENLCPLFGQDDSSDDHHMLIFKVPGGNADEEFVKAELRILTVVQCEPKSSFGIERLIKISLYNETSQQLVCLDEKHVYHTDNTWVSFNVSSPVETVLRQSSLGGADTTLKLVITIKSFLPYIDSQVGVFKISLMPVHNDFEHDYPILLLFYASTKTSKATAAPDGRNASVRGKRSVEDDFEEESNKLWEDDAVDRSTSRKVRRIRNSCRRKPLYVDFAEIQYDSWIVQPSGYEAYQCSGKCFYPVADHLSPTKHAIVQALLHSVAPSRAPRSCCVPTKLDSISVLYVDGHGVLTYRYGYKDMVVAECGCR